MLTLFESNGLPSRSAASLHTSARHSSGSIPSFTHNTAMTTPPRKRERSSNVPSPVPSLRADMPRPPPSPRMGIGSLTAPHSVGLRTNGPVLAPVLASPPADHVTSGRSFTPTAISRSLDSERRIPSDPLSLASQSTDGSRLPRTPLSIVERSHLRDTSWSDARSSNDPPQLKDGGLQSVNGAAVPEHEQWHDLGQ